MMNGKQFEIWLADLSPRFGTEAGKTRPVLIIQSDVLNKIHPSTIICPITSNIRKNVNILRVNLLNGVGGLNKDSAIMIDQVRAIDNKRLIKRIGILPSPEIENVKNNLRIVIDLS
jgi:mRNA interferase MazF